MQAWVSQVQNCHIAERPQFIDQAYLTPIELRTHKDNGNCVSATNCARINCHSISNKIADLKTHITHNHLDVCILMETWIKEDDTTTSALLCPLGYKSLLISRKKQRGGGFALVYSVKATAKISQIHEFKSMVCTSFIINLPTNVLHLVAVYRPPDRSVLHFALDMLDLTERSINVAGKLILSGNSNIRINDINCPETNTFLDLLECFGLTNHIRFTTHKSTSTITLVIFPKGTNYIWDPRQGRLFSDHHIVVQCHHHKRIMIHQGNHILHNKRHQHGTVPD